MKKPFIISFANSKGGVGKTTSCIAVGCCLAKLGYETLVIDLDHQGNLSDDFGRGDEDYTITDIFEDPKFDINKIVYSARDGDKEISNLSIIPADITLAVEARSAERFRHRLSILDDGLKRLVTHFDFILIDLRPAIDLSIENALLITDLIVIPVDMDRRAVKGIDDLFQVVKEIRRNDDFVYTLVKTKVNKSHSKMQKSTNKHIQEAGYQVASTEIRVSELYKQATEQRRPSPLYAPHERPYEDYLSLTHELLAKIKEAPR
ncbi:ParA family protein (plasmid) [Candidatus Fukatsuia symbiotica]|uniref:Cobalamin biosynthesis protein CbiA n=1 Tax=Candidatus Fukatsuia symbiotica TaxID=1878942 RepID=A0A2U8I8Y0_9GAMM|nr:ParA family protein [Candidatus Fukatsuia symbiotica]AWK15538.1 cobalamin biosynthesis protein CbiA [Candidatus Fukatsuia symbiotica]MEA9445929.1 ParA family protein [Candidatus Fukatsuia symbiotica]